MKRKLCRISVVLELVFVHFSNYRLLESWDMCWLDDGAGCYDASFCTRVNDPLDDKLSFPFFFFKKNMLMRVCQFLRKQQEIEGKLFPILRILHLLSWKTLNFQNFAINCYISFAARCKSCCHCQHEFQIFNFVKLIMAKTWVTFVFLSEILIELNQSEF